VQAAKPPSPSNTQGRRNQRDTVFTIWQVQSTVVLWRFFASWLACFEGANTVKNGKAQGRELHGNRTNSIIQTISSQNTSPRASGSSAPHPGSSPSL